jgi:transposase
MPAQPYTERQIQFIMDMRVQGYTYREIAEMFEEKFGEIKSIDSIGETFRRHKNSYDLPEFDKHPDKVKKERMESIMDDFLDFIKANKYVPTYSYE